jgi:HK97 family phage major capsid protein
MADEIETKEAVTNQLKSISDKVKEIGEKALYEAKKAGDMTSETKGKVDEMLVKQGELQARLLDVEQKSARRGAAEEQEYKSVGHQLIESKAYEDFKNSGRSRGTRMNFQTKAITTTTAGAGVAPTRVAGIVAIPDRRLTVRDLLTPGRTASNLVQYVRETGFTNNADTITETTRKPESTLTYDLQSTPVVKIAHYIKASTEIVDDAPQLQSQIDGRLRYGLAYVEENQLLKGSGVGNNLNGIYTQATAYSAPITITSPTRIDVLRLALLQAELALYPATGIVLHPSDWAAIELTKESTGAYVFANPQSMATPNLWGRPVVSTPAMTVDTFLVGAFKLGAQIFDREEANVVIATENEDDFVNNLVTIMAEERLALAVYRPQAFIKGDITPA